MTRFPFNLLPFIVAWMLCLLTIACIAAPPSYDASDPAVRPNIVIIYTDDMGYGDLSCYNAEDVQTSRLDRMADEGVRFTAFYNSSAACSPSRAALLTGSYHSRVSVRRVFPPHFPHGLHPDEITIADMLKPLGYATACIGKWHLGDAPNLMPNAQGFDYFYGIPVSHDYDHPHPDGLPLYENDRIVEHQLPDAYYTSRLTDKALQFIERHQDEPFLLYLAHPMPHVALAVTPPFEGVSQRGLYGDVMHEIDHNVGRIIDLLTELQLHERTLVIFLSDNGPWLSFGNHAGSTGGLRGGKRNTFEGGIRTPCILWGGMVQSGLVQDTPACAIDLLPTIAAMTGATVPDDRVIDGINIAALFHTGDDHPPVDPERPLIFYGDFNSNPLQSMRVGRWKLHLPHRTQKVDQVRHDGQRGTYRWRDVELSLYDLQTDPRETTDIKDEHPQVVARLLEIAERYRRELGDDITGHPPGPNVRPLGDAIAIPE